MIKISGSVLKMSGNPSRLGRVDNLFGLKTVEACVAIYNDILQDLGFEYRFTACTRLLPCQSDGSKLEFISDGALIKEIHIT